MIRCQCIFAGVHVWNIWGTFDEEITISDIQDIFAPGLLFSLVLIDNLQSVTLRSHAISSYSSCDVGVTTYIKVYTTIDPREKE